MSVRLTASQAPLDWARVAAWTEAVLSGELGEISRVFVKHGAGAPLVVWKPGLDQLRSEPPRHALAHWSNLAAGGSRLPRHRQISPLDLRPALGYVLLLDVVDNGRDFRYRLFGSTVVNVSGFDMTGKLLSEHPMSTYVTEFSLAVGRAAISRREPVYTLRHPVGTQETSAWERLVLPLASEDDSVSRLLVVSTPLDEAGELIRTIY